MVPSGARPRYRRLAAAGAALVVTLVTLLGGIGVLPTGSSASAASGHATSHPGVGTLSAATVSHPGSATAAEGPTGAAAILAQQAAARAAAVALPAGSGTGKRIVFDMSDQRVWLVDPDAQGDDEVARTYLVSGSLTDNLHPGTYAVYSKSRWAVGIDDSGTMEYFTRFTRGDNAAIGFHSIPTKNGRLLQTQAQLGTPQSHGCIRQTLTDARRLWDFAPVGTKVVVTA
jgi:lipoprotein-anchoring transpeptidase ErfK/SrfK